MFYRSVLLLSIVAFFQTSDSVCLDLLTFSDLEILRQKKAGAVEGKSDCSYKRTAPCSLTSKRYLIVTYNVEFDR